MNILTIAEVFPYPPHDGTKIQIYQRVRRLAADHRVTLLCLLTEPPEPGSLAHMERYCTCVVIRRRDFKRRENVAVGFASRAWNVLRSAWSRMPYYMLDEYSPEGEDWLRQNTRGGQFDVIEADIATAKYLHDWQDALKVWIWHSVGAAHGSHARLLDQGLATRARQAFYGRVTRLWERRQSQVVDISIALTKEDAGGLRRLGLSCEVWLALSNGIDSEYFEYHTPDSEARGVCFIGKMDYQPNEDAVLFFYRSVWPAIRSRDSRAILYIVGSKPSDSVKALRRDPSVRVTGYVDDVRPYLRRSVVAIAPMRMGGGILNKVLEAMASGVPVVATARAIQGIEAVPGRDLLVCNDKAELAAAVADLLDDYPRRVEIALAARALVERRHDWKATVLAYGCRLTHAVERRRRSGAPARRADEERGEAELSTRYNTASDIPGARPDRARPHAPAKILHLTSSNGLYGAERVIQLLAKTTDSSSFQVAVAALEKKRSSDRGLIEALSEGGLEAAMLPCDGRLDWKAVRRLLERIRKEQIQLLHCHEAKSRLYGVVAARLAGIAVLATHHNWVRQDLVTAAAEIIDAACLRFCDRVVAVSKPVARTVRRCGVPARRIAIIPNGVDVARFEVAPDTEFLQRHGVPAGLPLVGSVGRLDPLKAHDLLLHAARLVLQSGRDAAFLIVGEGPDRCELEALARSLGIAHRVFLLGYHERVETLYPALDVFVLGSKSEGFPMVLLEAMAARTPSIAAAVGGIPDVVRDEVNGLLLQDRKPETLAKLICRLLADKSFAQRIGEAGRRTVETTYSAAAVTRHYEAIYRTLIPAVPPVTEPAPANWAVSGNTT